MGPDGAIRWTYLSCEDILWTTWCHSDGPCVALACVDFGYGWILLDRYIGGQEVAASDWRPVAYDDSRGYGHGDISWGSRCRTCAHVNGSREKLLC